MDQRGAMLTYQLFINKSIIHEIAELMFVFVRELETLNFQYQMIMVFKAAISR